MSPTFALGYYSDATLGNTKLLPDSGIAEASIVEQAAYLCNLFFGEFCIAVFASVRMPALLVHIIMVVLGCAKKEMAWIAAWRIVAFMKNLHAIRYGAMCYHPGGAMRKTLPKETDVAHQAISALFFVPLPFPTFIGATLVNFQPETIFLAKSFGIVEVMATKIGLWFPLDIAARSEILFRDVCFPATTTVAITVWDFLSGIVRGMIIHSNVSLLDLLTPQDGSTHRCGNYLRASIIPQECAL